MIYTKINAVVQFHNFLHGFHTERGSGNNIMELKLAQELASEDWDPIFLVLL